MGQKKPEFVQSVIDSFTVGTIASESISFIKQNGTADSGEIAGTIVLAKLLKAPIYNLLGDTIGEYNPASSVATSIVFTTGVMDSTKEVGFVNDGHLDERISKTIEVVTAAGQGAWACNYLTGLLIINKATSGTTQSITSYKSPVGASSSSSFASSSASASGDNVYYAKPLGNNADASVAYTSAATITVTGLPFTFTKYDISSIQQIPTNGNVTTFTDVADFAVASGVITVTGASFAASDTFIVTLTGPRKAPFDPASGSNKSTNLNPLPTFNRGLINEAVTNETNATSNRYKDVTGLSQVSITFLKTGGTDSVTLRLFLSDEDDGTAGSLARYKDVTIGAVPRGGTTAATTYTASVSLKLDVLGAKFINVQTISAGGANDADYTLDVRGAY